MDKSTPFTHPPDNYCANRDDDIQWWRDRYNNLVSVMSCAVDGELVQVGDNMTKFPLSDGAKALLKRIAAQSAEVSVLKQKIFTASIMNADPAKAYIDKVAESLELVSGSPEPTLSEKLEQRGFEPSDEAQRHNKIMRNARSAPLFNMTHERLKRNPVTYMVEFRHDQDGLSFTVFDIQDSEHDRASVSADLKAAAESLQNGN